VDQHNPDKGDVRMKGKIKAWIREHQEEINEMFHRLHAIAEISWMEKETTKYLCGQLQAFGVPYTIFQEHTGLIAHWIGNKSGPTVALRADMDALWQNVDGEWKANHSCGHDAHMTMVLCTLKCLIDTGFQPVGTLKVIFQPAEETGKGAQKMVQTGLLNDVDAMLGIHIRPHQELAFGRAAPGIYHGASRLLRGRALGEQAHGARPHLGINVADSLAAIVNAVNALKMDPSVPFSAKVTMMKAGEGNLNIIPDFAEFGVDLRAQTNEAMAELLSKAERAIIAAGSANGAIVKFEVATALAAAKPNALMEAVVREAIIDALGKEAANDPEYTPGGEDFHYYSALLPQIKATMVGLGTGAAPGLHHPKMNFNLVSLQNGIEILSGATIKLFQKLEAGAKEIF
jgi:amidohydrolase